MNKYWSDYIILLVVSVSLAVAGMLAQCCMVASVAHCYAVRRAPASAATTDRLSH